jgi:tetratricopeptide (TPR) repeat protein
MAQGNSDNDSIVILDDTPTETIDVKQALAQAQTQFVEKKYTASEAAYTLILEVAPTNAQARFFRGYCYYASRKYTEALSDYEYSIRSEEYGLMSHYYSAHIYYRMNELKHALEKINLFIKNEYHFNPHYVKAIRLRIEIFKACDDLIPALQDLEFLLNRSKFTKGPTEALIAEIQTLIEAHKVKIIPSTSTTTDISSSNIHIRALFNSLIKNLKHHKDYSSAQGVCEDLIKLDPLNVQAKFYRSHCLLKLSGEGYDQSETIIQDLHFALSKNFSVFFCLCNLALNYHQMKQHYVALAYIEQAFTLFPEHKDKFYAFRIRGMIKSKLGQLEAALTDFKTAVTLSTKEDSATIELYSDLLEKMTPVGEKRKRSRSSSYDTEAAFDTSCQENTRATKRARTKPFETFASLSYTPERFKEDPADPIAAAMEEPTASATLFRDKHDATTSSTTAAAGAGAGANIEIR